MYEKELPYKIKSTLGFVFEYLVLTMLYRLLDIHASVSSINMQVRGYN